MENKSLYNKIIYIGLIISLFISSVIIYNYYNTYYAENTSFEEEKIFIYFKY